MSCRPYRKLFGPRLDGRLAAAELDVLEQHLQSCPACRDELRRWELPARVLRAGPLPPVPPGLAGRVRQAIAAGERVPSSLAQGFVAVARRAVLVAALAAAAFWCGLLLAGPAVGRGDAEAENEESEIVMLAPDPVEVAVSLWATQAMFEQEQDHEQ